MGVVQYEQVCCPPDGTEHGMRTGHREHPCQLAVPRIHLYCVRLRLLLFLDHADFLTRMTAAFLDKQPHLLERWSKLNPMGRIGRPDELRGVITWLASDASSFCTGSE